MTMMGIIMTMVGNADDADEDEHHDGDEQEEDDRNGLDKGH